MRQALRTASVLTALTVLSAAPAAAQTDKAGVVTTLEGNVTRTNVTLGQQPLKFRDEVFTKDKITTEERSLARMLLGGKAVVTVRERSTLTITENATGATIDLQAGKIALAVAKEKMRPGESIEIRAANAIAGVRGTVVVAEVSSGSAQVGGGGLTGTLWVLKGQIEAFLANQPGTLQSVSAMQQFRGGLVSNFLPSAVPAIISGLALSHQPLTKGNDGQAKENAVNNGLTALNSFSGVGTGGTTLVPPPTVVVNTAPILPNGLQGVPPPPPPPPQHRYCTY